MIHMTHFQCPLCGKHSSVERYHPETFDPDIDLIAYIGLGRGMGFDKQIVGSIEDDADLHEKLLNRAREVVAILEAM